MKRISRDSSQCGLTLIELMAAMLILAVLAVLAAPSFSRTLFSFRQRAAVQSLLVAFQFARVEAVTRQQAVTLCPLGVGPEICGTDYATGWQVFVDPDRDQRLEHGESLLRRFPALADGLVVSNRAGTRTALEPVTWYPDGSARRNLTLQVCRTGGVGKDAFSVVLNLVGRPRVARAEGICPGEAP